MTGMQAEPFVPEVSRLLDDERAYRAMSARENPFGEGTAGQQVVPVLRACPTGERNRPITSGSCPADTPTVSRSRS